MKTPTSTSPHGRFWLSRPLMIVALNVARRLRDEAVVVQCLIRRPDNRPLAELDAIVRHYQDEPLERLARPLRRHSQSAGA